MKAFTAFLKLLAYVSSFSITLFLYFVIFEELLPPKMKTLKYLFFLLAILFIAGAVYFSLKDGSYSISEEKVINAPASVIYEQVADFKNWEQWNPWIEDPEVTSTMGEITTGIGGNYSFEEEYGSGTMRFTSVDPNVFIKAQMNYDAGITQSQSEVTMQLEPVEKGTKIIWNIKGEDGLKNKVFNFIFGLDLEKELRPMYKKGLNKLDKVVQDKMNTFSISQPKVIQHSGGFLVYKSYKKTTTEHDMMNEKANQALKQFMFVNNITPYGNAMYHYDVNSTNDSLNVTVAYPIQEKIDLPLNSDINVRFMEPTNAVKISLKGDYKYLKDTRKTAYNYVTMSGLELSAAPSFEVYLNHLGKVENPANLKTDIYIPIKPQEND